jgi:hypothetical protein
MRATLHPRKKKPLMFISVFSKEKKKKKDLEGHVLEKCGSERVKVISHT